MIKNKTQKNNCSFHLNPIPQRVLKIIISKTNVVLHLKRYQKDFFYSKKILNCFTQLVDNLH